MTYLLTVLSRLTIDDWSEGDVAGARAGEELMTAQLNGSQLSMGPDTTGHFALVSVHSHCLIKAFFLLINHQSVFSVSDINFTKR